MAEELENGQEETKKPKQKKKGKKGLIIALAVLVPLLGAGGVLGAAYAGVLKIPGLKLPGIKTKSVAANYTDSDDKATELAKKEEESKPIEVEVTAEPEIEPQIIKEPEPVVDPELGAKKLAAIWNSMNAVDIVRISANYKDPEFARVLSKMESEKVAKVLAEIKDPKRAASISQEIESLASIIPTTET